MTRILCAHWAVTLAVCAGILVTPPIVSATFHIIVPERNMLLLLCAMLWAAVRYERRPSTGFLVVVGVAAFLFLQYKETAVVLVGLWAGYMILASWLPSTIGGAQRRNLILLGGSLMAGCAIWVLVYVVAILPQIDHSYVEGRQHDSIDVLHAVVTNAWAYILAASILGRLLLARAGFQHLARVGRSAPCRYRIDGLIRHAGLRP